MGWDLRCGLEMARGADLTLRIKIDAVPIMDEALAVYERGMTTGVNQVNRELVEAHTRFDRDLPFWHQEIFIDPQTSGGLLAAVPGAQADEVVAALHEAGVSWACRIGDVEELTGEPYLVFA